MPSRPPQNPSLGPTLRRSSSSSTDPIEQAKQEWWDLYWEAKRKWNKLSDEKRVALIKKVFDEVLEEAKIDQKKAARDFLIWLKSPEGAIMWAYIWRNEPGAEFAQLMVDITGHILEIIDVIVGGM